MSAGKKVSLTNTCVSVRVLCRNDNDNCPLVFAHQTKWQRRMLQLYSEHMCLIDATYKTTIYDMRLFFLCVLSNVRCLNVVTFLLSDEKQTSITKTQWWPRIARGVLSPDKTL